MQATARKLRRKARELGVVKHVKRDVYAQSYFTKKHTLSRVKKQRKHEEQ